MRRITSRSLKLSYANVMATVAVFVAVGGTATAAVMVTGADVRNGSLTGADVRNGSLRGRDIHSGSLSVRVFRPHAWARLHGATGPTGPTGPKGATGATGTTGAGGDAAQGFDATKFLAAGGAAGGALSGTFPDPGLADGAVTRPALASDAVDGSKVADGSLRIADLAAWSLAGGIGGSNSGASTCTYFSFPDPTEAQPSDLILVRSSKGVPAGLTLSAVLRPDGGLSGGTCNLTTSDIALPSGFNITVYGLR